MANKKAAEKYSLQSKKRYERNRWYKGRARTFIKKAREAMHDGDLPTASEAVRFACRALDMAAQTGVIHANNAARRKSRLVAALSRAQTEAA